MRIRLYGTGAISAAEEFPAGGVHLSNYEILHITGGKVRFRWTGKMCEAEAPAVFLISPSTPHELESLVPESKFRFLELADMDESPLTGEEMDDWNFRQSRPGLYAKSLTASAVLQSLEFVHHLYATEAVSGDPNLEEICLLEVRKIYRLIALMLHTVPSRKPAGGLTRKWDAREAADMLIDYMDWRYRETITLETMADWVRLNPSYLVRSFKKHKKMTPFEYLRDLRLKAAVSYLSGSDLPIGAIAEKTGFNSIHYFGRLFKRVYGQSPGEWRKQLKKK
ncbi:helix-turn-helix transcriptional regulator [Cohnella nanjingensis]|uniref:Helix-turn-helix transcriptional regulator n=1 Tax=Cohnella nanjingensis TaxID=1387779 RepID=A0A7X0RMD8_9BACL|nr:AraC family transcriptional regulator [Cohnella nanjingensis]MBB6670026.1 helix-turn-helix transcriptional regulator [Cohnella nanjingensis]